MNGGTILGNTATSSSRSYGGGVRISGTFTMNGGTISGNTAAASSSYGGGVYVGGGTFTKTGGIIYGYSTSDTANSNVVKNRSGTVSGRGPAVYSSSSPSRQRNITAGQTDHIDTTTGRGLSANGEPPFGE